MQFNTGFLIPKLYAMPFSVSMAFRTCHSPSFLTEKADFKRGNKAFIGKASSEASCLTDAQTEFVRGFCYVIAKIMLFLLQVGAKSWSFLFVHLFLFLLLVLFYNNE